VFPNRRILAIAIWLSGGCAPHHGQSTKPPARAVPPSTSTALIVPAPPPSSGFVRVLEDECHNDVLLRDQRRAIGGACAAAVPTRHGPRGWSGAVPRGTCLDGMDKKPRIFTMSFGSVYPLYVQKAAKKGRTKNEVDEIITWLTGYSGKQLQRVVDAKVDFETFFAKAPRMNPNVGLITGVVCGVRVEDVTDPLMQKIRYLDKLIDELARGKKMESILRT
jgi:hypothetical protein